MLRFMGRNGESRLSGRSWRAEVVGWGTFREEFPVSHMAMQEYDVRKK